MEQEHIFARAFGSLDGGKILDVATGTGSFIPILIEHLKSYSQIVGIDSSAKNIETAQNNYPQETIRFVQMDAKQLDFDQACFDTVSLSAVFHHLNNIPQVLLEVERVLKPGGHLVIAEMHRDGQTQAQLTFVYLHHWVADVDAAVGIQHKHTLSRQDFLDHVTTSGPYDIKCYDSGAVQSDPMDSTRIKQLDRLIDNTCQRAENVSGYKTLKQRGETLRQRLHQVGAQPEPRLIIVGKKAREKYEHR